MNKYISLILMLVGEQTEMLKVYMNIGEPRINIRGWTL